MKSLAIAPLGLLWLGSLAAGEAANTGASDLVRAMRADVMLLEASKDAIGRATREGYFTDAQFQCFRKLPASAFTDGIASVLTTELTSEEITEALAFYQSPVGSKFVDYIFETLRRESGGSFTAQPADSESSMSFDEMRAAMDFSKTGVGKKLTQDQLIMKSPESDALAKRVVARQLAACGAKVPGAAR